MPKMPFTCRKTSDDIFLIIFVMQLFLHQPKDRIVSYRPAPHYFTHLHASLHFQNNIGEPKSENTEGIELEPKQQQLSS
jgi:hypothetical protein